MSYPKNGFRVKLLLHHLHNKRKSISKSTMFRYTVIILVVFFYSCAPNPRKTVECFIAALNHMEYEKALTYVEESSEIRAGLMELIRLTALVGPDRVTAVRDSLKKGLKQGTFRSYKVIRENRISDVESIVALEESHEDILGNLVVDTVFFQLKKVKGKWLIVKEITL